MGAAAPARQFGFVPAVGRSDRFGFRSVDGAGRVDAGLVVAPASPDVSDASVARDDASVGSAPGDLWAGLAHGTRPPRRRIGPRAAEKVVLCRACRARA